jgi:hypothetical protein
VPPASLCASAPLARPRLPSVHTSARPLPFNPIATSLLWRSLNTVHQHTPSAYGSRPLSGMAPPRRQRCSARGGPRARSYLGNAVQRLRAIGGLRSRVHPALGARRVPPAWPELSRSACSLCPQSRQSLPEPGSQVTSRNNFAHFRICEHQRVSTLMLILPWRLSHLSADYHILRSVQTHCGE